MAALTAGVSAYAANPFSDVTPNDWAYQAVADLSEQGVVEGYPDGTFKGERNITRYELAQIIARMLANEDQMSSAQLSTNWPANMLTNSLIWASEFPTLKRRSGTCTGPAMPVCVTRTRTQAPLISGTAVSA